MSNRMNGFDESGVWCFSIHIPGACRPLIALHIDLLIPQEVISDVNTKILLGRVNFKLRVGHMIDKDDGFKFPSYALRFASAVVQFRLEESDHFTRSDRSS